MPDIKKITIEGFVSIIEKIKYKFDRPGLNIISGKNGAGKTTILNALAYGLYGQTLKPKSSILPWPKLIGDSNYRGLHIAVEVDEYTIHRCVDFKGKVLGKMGKNRLVIEKGEKELSNLRGKVDAQKFINEYIGYTFQLFKTSILFAQELTSLLEDDGPTKKKTFDEAFASAFINRAKETADRKLKTLQDEQKNLHSQYEAKDEIRKRLHEVVQQLVEANKNFALEKASSISNLRKKIKQEKELRKGKGTKNNLIKERRRFRQEIREAIGVLELLRQQVNPRLRDEEFQLMLDVNRYQSELEGLKQKQKILKYQKAAKCEECGSKLKGDKLVAHKKHKAKKFTELKHQEKEVEKSLIYTRNRHEATKKQLDEQSDSIKQLEDAKDELKGLEKKFSNVRGILADIAISSTKIKSLKQEISRIRKNVKKNDTSKIKQDILDTAKEMSELTQKITTVKKKAEIQAWLIKDPLSNSGLKAYIFDSMLRRVNHFLKGYKEFIGFDVRVGMDLESSNKDFEVIITRLGEEVPYADISKGQKQLAKAVLCFAMNKTLQGSKPLNILLMDELFETLDPDNVEIIGNIIQTESKTKCVHLITHHALFNPPNCYKIFVAQNAKGQTFIEQKYREA